MNTNKTQNLSNESLDFLLATEFDDAPAEKDADYSALEARIYANAKQISYKQQAHRTKRHAMRGAVGQFNKSAARITAAALLSAAMAAGVMMGLYLPQNTLDQLNAGQSLASSLLQTETSLQNTLAFADIFQEVYYE